MVAKAPAHPSTYTVVREILTEDIKLDTDTVIARAKEKGVTGDLAAIRKIVNKTRSEMRKRSGGKGGEKGTSIYTLARQFLTADATITNDDVLARIKASGATKGDSEIRTAIRSVRNELLRRGVAKPNTTQPAAEVEPFRVVSLAAKTASLCGGVTKAREIAESIRSCGGLDAFLKGLSVVAEVLASDAEA